MVTYKPFVIEKNDFTKIQQILQGKHPKKLILLFSKLFHGSFIREPIRLFFFVCFGKFIVNVKSMKHRMKSKDHFETLIKI